MELKVNIPKYNRQFTIFINSSVTVLDLKKIIMSTYPRKNEITLSNLEIYYKDKAMDNSIYMLSSYRPVLSYDGLNQIREIYVEEIGLQINSFLSIFIENILPLLTFYFFYKSQDNYYRTSSHFIIFFLICVYFLSRIFVSLFIYRSQKYFLTKLIVNFIFYWFLFAVIIGKQIFSNDFIEFGLFEYCYCLIFIFSDLLCIKCFNEKKENDINKKDILFRYVKCPYYLIDCLIWLLFALIIRNLRGVFISAIKILYNIYLSFEIYIEEQGKDKGIKKNEGIGNPYQNLFNEGNNNNFGFNSNIIGDYNNKEVKVIFPFLL